MRLVIQRYGVDKRSTDVPDLNPGMLRIELRAGQPEGLARLLAALHAAMAPQGIDDWVGPSRHHQLQRPARASPPKIKEIH